MKSSGVYTVWKAVAWDRGAHCPSGKLNVKTGPLLILCFGFSVLLVFDRLFFCIFRNIFRWCRVLLKPSTSLFTIISHVFFSVLTNGPPQWQVGPFQLISLLAQTFIFTPMVKRSLHKGSLIKLMVLKLCVATPWCVVLIFQGCRTKVNSVQFYSLSW